MKNLKPEIKEAQEAVLFTEQMDLTADDITTLIMESGAAPGNASFDLAYNAYLLGLSRGLRAREIMESDN